MVLEVYLRDLERELARELPPEAIAVRLSEVEAHLRDGIEARLELGLSNAEAERESIDAFGLPREVGRQMRQQAAASATARVRWLASGYGLGILFCLFRYRLFEPYPYASLWFLWALGGIGAAFAFASFRARRPATLSTALTGTLGTVTVWIVLGTTWLNLDPYGGGGAVPPGEANRWLEEAQRQIRDKRTDRQAFYAGWRTLNGPAGIEGLRADHGYQSPVIRSRRGSWDRLEISLVADPQAATTAWKEIYRRQTLFDTDWLERMAAAIPKAQNASAVSNLQSMAPQIVPPNLGVAAGAVLIDIIFAGLGAAALRVRRRSRERGTPA